MVRSFYTNLFIDHCIFQHLNAAINGNYTDGLVITNCAILSSESFGNGAIDVTGNANEIAYNLFYSGEFDPIHLHPGIVIGPPNYAHNNIIVGHVFEIGYYISIIGNTRWEKNTIVDNVTQASQNFILLNDSCSFQYNTIVRNAQDPMDWSTWRPVSAWYSTHFNHNNILRNDTFVDYWSKYYSFGAGVNYQSYLPHQDVVNNYWGTSDPNLVDSLIFDYSDNNTLCIADYTPFLPLPDTIAPVIPPSEVHKTDLGAGSVLISWEPNLETDLAGYKVYWGNFTGYSFANSIDAGNVTSYILSGVSINDTIGVTAYDTQANGVRDQFDGNESWFTYAITGLQIGINELSSELNAKIFPNPFNNEFTILFSEELREPVKIEILNALGQRMIYSPSVQNRTTTISGISLPSGIYECRIISTSGNVYSRKLVRE